MIELTPDTREYNSPGPVAMAFRASRARRRVITGPFGSGKSVACCIDIMTKIQEQKAGPDGVRKSRWAVVRNTYPDLKNTTVRTWKDWANEEDFGQFVNVAPFEHHIRYEMEDGTMVEADVIFIAMDSPDDVKKFLSLEVTGIYFNEVRELHRAVVEAGDGRIGRYPAMKDGGPSWYGIIADTNMPDEEHWLYELAEGGAEGWEFYHQPGGVKKVEVSPASEGKLPVFKWVHNDKAENLANLVPGYYTEQLAGKSDDWIKVFLGAEYGTLPTEGAFFAELMSQADREDRIGGVPYQRERGVDTWWDLGYSDDTAIWFIQVIRGEVHVIDYYEKFGQDIPHYAELVQSKPYVYNKHHLPHDARAETLQGGGRSIVEQLANFLKLEKMQVHLERDPQERIQAARSVLPRCYFDKLKCKDGIRALRNYRREYDDARGCYKRTPLHDRASHGSDAFGMFAYNYLADNPAVTKQPVYRNPTLDEIFAAQGSGMRESRIG